MYNALIVYFENIFVSALRKSDKPWESKSSEFFSKYHRVLVLLNTK